MEGDIYYLFLELTLIFRIVSHSEVPEASMLDRIEYGLKNVIWRLQLIIDGEREDKCKKISTPTHSLLHPVDYVRQAGPLRQHWSFGMERMCKIAKQMSVATQKPLVPLANQVCLRFLAQLSGCYSKRKEMDADEGPEKEGIAFSNHKLAVDEVGKLEMSPKGRQMISITNVMNTQPNSTGRCARNGEHSLLVLSGPRTPEWLSGITARPFWGNGL
ncbi:hypothetical protein TRICI_005067 [Trichomonascus ciferrii]|uniref:Uncharacterized protein n=1 Tax=Trichomonascus ciferrii TaxID=44093 RepID=A0A642UWP1_9ASCO|nr:hypothetical protein TRICI_005067 [Trichomonascus ciferrii]